MCCYFNTIVMCNHHLGLLGLGGAEAVALAHFLKGNHGTTIFRCTGNRS